MHEIYISNYGVCEHSGFLHTCLTHEVMIVFESIENIERD
jgi:hypothetical protein